MLLRWKILLSIFTGTKRVLLPRERSQRIRFRPAGFPAPGTNVILLGEMRDHETISIAMTAAETGHLILSTLHTLGAANTIDRVIDAFPPSQQQQIRTQLSMVLDAVICQQLVPALDGGERPVFEIMFLNNAIGI